MSRSRVLSLRLTEREYEVLSALSVIEDESVSTIIRRAIAAHVRSVSQGADFAEKTRKAEDRAREARRALLASIDIEDTGPIYMQAAGF